MLGIASAAKLRSNCDAVTVRTCPTSTCDEDCGTVTLNKLDGLCQTGTDSSSSFTCTPKTYSETSFATGDCSGDGKDFTLIWGVCTALPNGKYQIAYQGL